MHFCVHIVVKIKQTREKGPRKCQGWATVLYRLVSKGLIKQVTSDQRPEGKEGGSPEDAKSGAR